MVVLTSEPRGGAHYCSIREIPDHATFRGKGANTGWLDKVGLFPLWSYVIRPNYSVLYKM